MGVQASCLGVGRLTSLEGLTAPAATGLFCRMRAHRSPPLIALAGLALAACADVVVVDSGHRAVLMTPDGAVASLGEGTASVPADSVVHDFDLRQQEVAGSFTAVTADGVPLVVRDPVVSFSWVPEEVVDADRSIGPQGAPAIVATIVGSTITRVLASYRWDQLDTAHIREAQAKISSQASAALRPRHLALGSVEIKGLEPRLPELARAVTDTSVWQQRGATAATNVELARKRAENLHAAAAGIASANASVAPTLTPAVLEDKGDKAWQALILAPTTAVEITNEPSPSLEVGP